MDWNHPNCLSSQHIKEEKDAITKMSLQRTELRNNIESTEITHYVYISLRLARYVQSVATVN